MNFLKVIGTPEGSRTTSSMEKLSPGHWTVGQKKVAPMKPPWRSPNHKDFASKIDPVHSPSQLAQTLPTEKNTSSESGTSIDVAVHLSSANKLTSKSMDSLNVSLSGAGSDGAGRMSKLKQPRSSVRRANGTEINPEAKDESLNYRYYGRVPLFARSCLNSLSTSSSDDDHRPPDVVGYTADARSVSQDLAESEAVVEQPAVRSGNIDAEPPVHPVKTPSPHGVPRGWLRREESDNASPSENPNSFQTVLAEPSWTMDDGKLHLVFPQNVTAGPYRVKIEAHMKLTKPDSNGWRNFELLGLPSNELKETTGVFEFIIKPSLTPLELPEFQFDARHLLDSRTLGSKELIARFRLLDPLSLRLRSKDSIRYINSWNTAVTLYTVPKWSRDEGTQMKHHASLTFELPDHDIFAEKVKFSIIVKCGPGRNYSFDTDEDSVHLTNDYGLKSGAGLHVSEAEITIVRSIRNLSHPIDLFFALGHADMEYMTMTLPTFRPKAGNVLSERMMLLKTSPPLFLDYLARGQFSTWKMTENHKGEETWICLDRIEVPRLFPDGLKDNAMVRVRKLYPVHFEVLEAWDSPLTPEHPSNIIQDLEIKIEKVFGEELECRMGLKIRVGSSCRLLTIDDHDWTPKFFVIDGNLATQNAGEWRENEDGYKTLFKSSTMSAGQMVKLEMHWKELVISDEFKSEGAEKTRIEYNIPRILGKIILGGDLLCRIDEGLYPEG